MGVSFLGDSVSVSFDLNAAKLCNTEAVNYIYVQKKLTSQYLMKCLILYDYYAHQENTKWFS